MGCWLWERVDVCAAGLTCILRLPYHFMLELCSFCYHSVDPRVGYNARSAKGVFGHISSLFLFPWRSLVFYLEEFCSEIRGVVGWIGIGLSVML